jgi:hypothetical protein
MIAPAVFAAFFVGLIAEALTMAWLDRRAVRREALFWEELRLQALDGYGHVFDWAEDDA